MKTLRSIALNFIFQLLFVVAAIAIFVFLEVSRNRELILPLLVPLAFVGIFIGFFSVERLIKSIFS